MVDSKENKKPDENSKLNNIKDLIENYKSKSNLNYKEWKIFNKFIKELEKEINN